ncbi:Hypothetical protein ETEE_1794 [Edwardsiella anguillarum ET080813]|uniref:Uncharacterized protein n=1 Tax=Edwardsiella anguillarum ET080813 TaxID=667120 RepID=A0A076LJV6_9GAMM|nr:Hypothetical protein ETEE_1794 [Edwardsiella anguillarum ET080813]
MLDGFAKNHQSFCMQNRLYHDPLFTRTPRFFCDKNHYLSPVEVVFMVILITKNSLKA